jgi:hypothetical protein
MQTNGTRHSRIYEAVLENSTSFYEGKHGFRTGYSCEIQIITIRQGISDSLEEATRIDAIIIDFSKVFD